MILIDSAPLEIDLLVLSYLDIRSLMNCLLLCKCNYQTFHNFLLPCQFADFYFTEIKFFHRAIMYNKYNILKWLIKNRILAADRIVLCKYYKNNDPCCFRHEYLDISLALACLFADDRVYGLLISHKPIKPITNSSKFNYIEYLIADQRCDQRKKIHIEQHMQLYDKPYDPSYKRSLHIIHKLKFSPPPHCDYYQFFINALYQYRLRGYWDLSIRLYHQCSDTS